MRELVIANHRIADDEPSFVIAEVGHNHGGSVERCKEMFAAAKWAGADAVKLQKRSNRDLFTADVYDAPYDSEHAFGPTYGAHREALEFGWDEYVELKAYAEGLGLVFFATAFDVPSACFLDRLGVPAFKIASGDLRSIPLIRFVAGFQKPILVSTGGGTLEDVDRVYDLTFSAYGNHLADESGQLPVPRSYKSPDIAILQCTAAYPVQPHEMNLRVIETYRGRFPDIVIGLSDHYDGIMPGPVAYTLGARIFEKHFTLDHNAKGSDHRFSLEPEGMRRFVRDLRAVEAALGDGVKRPYESEAPGLRKMRKTLVYARDLPAGHILTPADIEMRTASRVGTPPYMMDDLVGLKLHEAVQAGALL